jgi:predicted enzyme related to lactoylglutathione lyase
MAESTSLSQLVWIDIPVHDLDRAVKWYSAVLGCTVDVIDIGEDCKIGVLPHHNGAGGCLIVEKGMQPSQAGPLVYLRCEGRLDAAIAAVEPHGGRVLKPKRSIEPHGWSAVVLDSEGNRFALHSHVT